MKKLLIVCAFLLPVLITACKPEKVYKPYQEDVNCIGFIKINGGLVEVPLEVYDSQTRKFHSSGAANSTANIASGWFDLDNFYQIRCKEPLNL